MARTKVWDPQSQAWIYADRVIAEAGTSVTIDSIVESDLDGGINKVIFSDGNSISIKNGTKGESGENGTNGENGQDGITPHVGNNGNWFIGDNDTGIPATGPAGDQGEPGAPGANGKDGVPATHSWNGTTLTITSASGTSSANLKGDKGDTGAGGSPGADGVSPTLVVSKSGKVTTITITDKDGTKTATINDGADGSNGSNGKDGTSVTVKSVSESTADGGSNVITFSDGKTVTIKNGSKGSTGATGSAGKNGADGYTPVRGTDYWTEADKVEIVQRVIESLGGNPIFGIVDENNNIIVSGDLADGTYSVKYEMENGSTVNIGNLVLDTNVYCTVTNNLTQCTTNNSATKAVQGGSYSATITAVSGYELKSVTVTMGGSPVTVSGGTISIANVTGNIVITAVAEEKVVAPSYTNFADPTSADWKTGYRLSDDINGTTSLTGGIVTNYISVQKGDTLEVTGINISDSNSRQAFWFNSSNNSILRASALTGSISLSGVSYDANSLICTVAADCDSDARMRFSGLATGTSEDVVIKIKRNGVYL